MNTSRIRKQVGVVLSVGALLLLQACGDCAGTGSFAISVTVVDATTHTAPTSVPNLRVADGAYVDTRAQPVGFQGEVPILEAGADRPGMYDVLVKADGYQDFTVNGVKVSTLDNACNSVKTVKITASMIPILQK